ncbi:MAG TPA: gamma-glutamyl-gamma-aminobutyrate hydrolase family protein [Thermoleophilaceae bacterium]
MSAPPLIGVSTSEVRRIHDHDVVAHGEPARQELALGERYLEAVRLGGGMPVILAPVPAGQIDALLDRLDALCLSGGPDIHPAAYGAEPHTALGPTEPELDRFEIQLARRACARGIPVLGICRGTQVLNVALGGSLHQHLPDQGDEIDHRQTLNGGKATHSVELEPDSRLAHLLGRDTVDVNSFHHQATDRLGRRLRVVGRAPDGTIEAIERASGGFLFGVQWHAEWLVDRPEQLRLFQALVQAARGEHHVAPRAVEAA